MQWEIFASSYDCAEKKKAKKQKREASKLALSLSTL